ncbi:amino acid transporter-like protein [Lojkania enalia]|uniref:Amino acid transporter-like protein n=1 Tax=Lojkania enalia TaxID=147567 RepID=A0A9P4KFE1_9PLEO|nr:amino acid transporter-like protein [Didymosphaeria enalia]
MSSKPGDEANIARFGKKQQFKRNFNLLSVLGLSTALMLSWEGVLLGIQPSLFNGGPSGMITAYPIVFVGVLSQTVVMAEMASMIPLSGGQFNWVAILAPPRLANFLSYITGWVSTIAWQAGFAVSAYLVANLTLAIALTQHPEYALEYKNWHALLVIYAIVLVGVIVNTYLGVIFPALESMVFIVHIIGYFIILIVLAYLAPKQPASFVFENFFNGGEFSTMGQSVLAGAVPIMLGFAGSDAGSHIAEEIKNAPKVIPLAMIINIVGFFLLGYSMIILTLFSTSIEEVFNLGAEFSFPIIPIFIKVTNSLPATVALISMIIFIGLCGTWGLQATASRMLWAFAREGGVPGSRFISKIDERTKLPFFATAVTSFIAMILNLIGLFSITAFSAFAGLTVAGFYSAFIISAFLMLWRRLVTPAGNIPWGWFRLGPLGVPITIFALAYSIVGIVFSFWPSVAAVDVQTFNWAVVVYLGTLILASVRWIVTAKGRYSGPRIEIAGAEPWIELFDRRGPD